MKNGSVKILAKYNKYGNKIHIVILGKTLIATDRVRIRSVSVGYI